MIYLLIFVFGLVIGSFLDCLVSRWQTDESFVYGRSACPHCRHQLSFKDLVPVLSWVFLLGRCRYCRKSIPFTHLLTEIGTGLIFLSIFHWAPLSHVAPLAVISCFLILIFLYDLKHSIVLDRIIYPAIVLSFVFPWWAGYSILHHFLAGVGAALFFFCLWFFSRGKAMGFGDVKIALMMGFLLGYPNVILALFLAFTIGAIIGVVSIALRKKGMKSEIPFGPFLTFGTLVALLFGERIIEIFLYELF